MNQRVISKSRLVRKGERTIFYLGQKYMAEDFFYACEFGEYVITCEPCEGCDFWVYIPHNLKANYPLSPVGKNKLFQSTDHKFEDLEDAEEFAENLLKEVIEEEEEFNLSLSEHVRNQSGYYFD